jgi:hypothetical protein
MQLELMFYKKLEVEVSQQIEKKLIFSLEIDSSFFA